jgi:hypothetical protein
MRKNTANKSFKLFPILCIRVFFLFVFSHRSVEIMNAKPVDQEYLMILVFSNSGEICVRLVVSERDTLIFQIHYVD